MKKRRKKKKGSRAAAIVVLLILFILVSAGILGYMVFTGNGTDSNPVVQAVNREVTKKAVETVIAKETGTDVTIEKVKEQMSEEDAKELEETLNRYADEGIVQEAISTYRENGGDLQETARSLQDRVSEEDMARLRELYDKYKDQVGVLTN